MKRREEQERMIREEIINKMQTEREEKEKQNKRLVSYLLILLITKFVNVLLK